MMRPLNRTTYLTRDTILKLLSDDEVARVSAADGSTTLADGDEYVDLDAPHHGIRKSVGSITAPTARVLPRKAVLAKTWRRVVTLIASQRGVALPN